VLGERLLIIGAPVAPVWALFEALRRARRATADADRARRRAAAIPELLAERDRAHARLAAALPHPEAAHAASDPGRFQREFPPPCSARRLAGQQALAAQPGAVYRNTVLRGCIDALAALSTVATLVGASGSRPPQAGSPERPCLATAASPSTAKDSPSSWMRWSRGVGSPTWAASPGSTVPGPRPISPPTRRC
jgi:hypothetical protein